MYFNQDYSDRILGKVEDPASRVHLLKERFNRRVEQLEEGDDSQCNRDYERIDATWNELVRSVDALLAEPPVKSLTREEAVSNHQFEEQTSA